MDKNLIKVARLFQNRFVYASMENLQHFMDVANQVRKVLNDKPKILSGMDIYEEFDVETALSHLSSLLNQNSKKLDDAGLNQSEYSGFLNGVDQAVKELEKAAPHAKLDELKSSVGRAISGFVPVGISAQKVTILPETVVTKTDSEKQKEEDAGYQVMPETIISKTDAEKEPLEEGVGYSGDVPEFSPSVGPLQ